MQKYKFKRKTNQPLIISIVIIAILLFISIGYSLWSDTIFINVKSNLRYVEPKLENITFTRDSEDDCIFRSEDSDVDLGKCLYLNEDTLIETVDSNTNSLELYVEYNTKNQRWMATDTYVTLTFYFTNDNNFPLTLGTYELLEQSLGYKPTFTMPESIGVGETGTFKTDFKITAHSKLKIGKYRYKIKYQAGEVTRYMYFTVNLVK